MTTTEYVTAAVTIIISYPCCEPNCDLNPTIASGHVGSVVGRGDLPLYLGDTIALPSDVLELVV
jgi:hypothetical protein